MGIRTLRLVGWVPLMLIVLGCGQRSEPTTAESEPPEQVAAADDATAAASSTDEGPAVDEGMLDEMDGPLGRGGHGGGGHGGGGHGGGGRGGSGKAAPPKRITPPKSTPPKSAPPKSHPPKSNPPSSGKGGPKGAPHSAHGGRTGHSQAKAAPKGNGNHPAPRTHPHNHRDGVRYVTARPWRPPVHYWYAGPNFNYTTGWVIQWVYENGASAPADDDGVDSLIDGLQQLSPSGDE